MFPGKKIAIVYDWIDKWGGVERVLLNFHEIFPQADFYTSYFDKKTAAWAHDLKIKTSFLQKFPDLIKKNRILSLVFYPFIFESFNFSDYDLVISVTSSFAKSIITKPGTQHICYLLTPTRYLWIHERDYQRNSLVSLLAKGYLDYLKKWDYVTVKRPDKIISISKTVRERTKKFYKQESEMIYPGFDIEYWKKIKSEVNNQKSKIQVKSKKFFLVVSRLELYKKIDLVIKTFNLLKQDLIVVGNGTEEKYLRQIAGKNTLFQSKLSDAELGNLYSNAQALIMPQEEDFGYVSLEAQFFGCPVIAYRKGGSQETVIDGKTGIFFNSQNGQSLRRGIERFHKIKYTLRKNTFKFGLNNIERFDKKIFEKKFIELLK